jgi:peptide-methionine (R)-S-oxide reductase
MADKIKKSEAEWKAERTPEQYRVARQKGTEPAFSGEYYETKTPGTYKCQVRLRQRMAKLLQAC